LDQGWTQNNGFFEQGAQLPLLGLGLFKAMFANGYWVG
jgi:hypothetical protein